ncbi:hypothetical protein X797_006668 [Metarhizium robertsii]|uniref:Secreted protein n=1 Tax=Metarhizium robertsii TaxID=568076 RepID=A0A0A1UU13_9HYPO|nr:hypothetical protein X797_006668 [Metarhizium robertsii]
MPIPTLCLAFCVITMSSPRAALARGKQKFPANNFTGSGHFIIEQHVFRTFSYPSNLASSSTSSNALWLRGFTLNIVINPSKMSPPQVLRLIRAYDRSG